ncbi:hypothetical protein Pmani_020307 [Petrolisthes manimaculis]|uniref:Uncharacterized protein n=1 Tax=Petrolisthes manimaculis TaxID=1843537 RepID=A0AAE1PIN2_9EUCA|nr:hypothetical protein Pmani_020307 [Petrolisthes manimaculis]
MYHHSVLYPITSPLCPLPHYITTLYSTPLHHHSILYPITSPLYTLPHYITTLYSTPLHHHSILYPITSPLNTLHHYITHHDPTQKSSLTSIHTHIYIKDTTYSSHRHYTHHTLPSTSATNHPNKPAPIPATPTIHSISPPTSIPTRHHLYDSTYSVPTLPPLHPPHPPTHIHTNPPSLIQSH